MIKKCICQLINQQKGQIKIISIDLIRVFQQQKNDFPILTLQQHPMQNLIQHHNNPMKDKRPFIKKSGTSNLSFCSKPNLSATKASNRFSFDKTFTCPSYRHQTYIKSARETENESTYPQILQQQHPKTGRVWKGKQNIDTSRRRMSLRADKRNLHKQRLQLILQQINMNNTMIQELFEHDEEITHYKQEIKKTIQLYQDLHGQLEKEVLTTNRRRSETMGPYSFTQRNKEMNRQQLCNKIEQLRMKRSVVIRQRQLRNSMMESSPIQPLDNI